MSDLRPRLAIAVLLSLLWLIVDPFLSFVVVVVVCPSGVMIRCLRSVVVEEAAIGELEDE
jgi:hypothetical protein